MYLLSCEKAFKEGAEIIFDLRDPQILKFKKLRTSVVRENHLLLGLVRFVVLKMTFIMLKLSQPMINCPF